MKALFLAMVLTAGLSTAFAQRGERGVREGGGRRGATAVFVVFSSFGTGIDSVTAGKTQKSIAKFDREGTVVRKSKSHWGREGETTYCVEFNSPFLPHQFIKGIAPSILKDRATTGMERTDVFSGISCDNIEAASRQNISAYVD